MLEKNRSTSHRPNTLFIPLRLEDKGGLREDAWASLASVSVRVSLILRGQIFDISVQSHLTEFQS